MSSCVAAVVKGQRTESRDGSGLAVKDKVSDFTLSR